MRRGAANVDVEVDENEPVVEAADRICLGDELDDCGRDQNLKDDGHTGEAGVKDHENKKCSEQQQSPLPVRRVVTSEVYCVHLFFFYHTYTVNLKLSGAGGVP